MFVETRYEHISLNEQNAPVIAGTNLKVKELAAERLAWGWSPEELLINHPHLTLGQIFSALAYYADHQEAMDAEIAGDAKFVDDLRKKAKPSPLITRLKTQGLI
jgi:uncharacterized protein (DUF433 family)